MYEYSNSIYLIKKLRNDFSCVATFSTIASTVFSVGIPSIDVLVPSNLASNSILLDDLLRTST